MESMFVVGASCRLRDHFMRHGSCLFWSSHYDGCLLLLTAQRVGLGLGFGRIGWDRTCATIGVVLFQPKNGCDRSGSSCEELHHSVGIQFVLYNIIRRIPIGSEISHRVKQAVFLRVS